MAKITEITGHLKGGLGAVTFSKTPFGTVIRVKPEPEGAKSQKRQNEWTRMQEGSHSWQALLAEEKQHWYDLWSERMDKRQAMGYYHKLAKCLLIWGIVGPGITGWLVNPQPPKDPTPPPPDWTPTNNYYIYPQEYYGDVLLPKENGLLFFVSLHKN